MQLNLLKGVKGQARKLANTIRNLSPKMKDVVTYKSTPVNGKSVRRGMQKYVGKENKILEEKFKAFFKDRETKEGIYAQQDTLSKESIYDVLLSQFMEDTFGIDPDDQVVSVEILDEDVEMRELLEVFPNDAFDRTNLDEILTNNLKSTFLKYGELFLEKQYTGNLVTGFTVLEGQYTYPITNGVDILFYIVIDPITNDFDIIEANKILAFLLNPQSHKIVCSDSELEKLLRCQPEEFKALIPNAYLMGTPLLYNARNELSTLRLANLLSDLAYLRALLMPTFLAVNVENIRDEEQLSEMLDVYQEWLEDSIDLPDLDDIDDVDLTDLLNLSVKVLPVEGSGKNGLSSIDIALPDSTNNTDYVQKKKEDIAFAAGFPLSAVSVQSDTTSKTDLSTNRRYRNRCKAAQRFIVRPLHDWIIEDFDSLGIDVVESNVRLFCKPIVSLDSAEDLEVALGAITQASSVYEQLMIIEENCQKYGIDEDGYFDYFNTLLGSFKGARKLLREREVTEEEPTLDNTEDTEAEGTHRSPLNNRTPNTPRTRTNTPRTNTPDTARTGIDVTDLGDNATLVEDTGETNE